MTNPVAPFGLRPVRHFDGKPFSGGGNLYIVPASVSGNLFIGDPVTLLTGTGGSNTAAYYGYAPGTLAAVGPITAGDSNPVLGSVVAFFPETAYSPIYSLASTVRGVYVADDPDLEFEIMDDGGSALTATAVGRNANFNISTYSGNTNTGTSGATLNATTLSSTANGQMHILGMIMQPNMLLGTNAIWRVFINQHSYRIASAPNV
jgi:hypothetical protein